MRRDVGEGGREGKRGRAGLTGSKQSLQKLITNYAFGSRGQIVKPASAAEVGTLDL